MALVVKHLPANAGDAREVGLIPGLGGKASACQCRRCKRSGVDPWVGKISWNRKWQPPPVFLPGKSHGQRSLAGYPCGHRELDMTERLSTHTHFTDTRC